MDLKTLRNFLAIAEQENMSRAADLLNVSQSTLSKQIKLLEEELGRKLFSRHSFSMSLTDDGARFRERARDLVLMADKIENEFQSHDDITGGELYLGLAESYNIRYLARSIMALKKKYPDLHYHITSGDTEQVAEKLDRGILDFAVLADTPDYEKYNALPFPEPDVWGLIIPVKDPLANKKLISFDDLKGLPLFCSEQGWKNDIPKWCGEKINELTLEGSFRLSYNGSVFTSEGLGYMLTFDKLIHEGEGSGLCFRPLTPALETKLYLIWRKKAALSPIAERFLDQIKRSFS